MSKIIIPYVPVDILQENEDGTEILIHRHGILDKATGIMFCETYGTEEERDVKLNSIIAKLKNETIQA